MIFLFAYLAIGSAFMGLAHLNADPKVRAQYDREQRADLQQFAPPLLRPIILHGVRFGVFIVHAATWPLLIVSALKQR
jgi:hypothetical protein